MSQPISKYGSNTPANQNNLNQQSQQKLNKMKIDMNMQFEREVMVKKEIYEIDMMSEDFAFKLFSK